jgi:hypothetical protein
MGFFVVQKIGPKRKQHRLGDEQKQSNDKNNDDEWEGESNHNWRELRRRDGERIVWPVGRQRGLQTMAISQQPTHTHEGANQPAG